MSQQPKSQNITKIETKISRADREKMMGQRGVTVWFTGLSGSGKSTVAIEVDRILTGRNVVCTILDGDNVRHGLNSDLGFSPEDRNENIRRIGEVAKLFADSGVEIAGLGSAFEFHSKDPDEVRRNIEGSKEYAQLAVDVGAPGIKIRPNGLHEDVHI